MRKIKNQVDVDALKGSEASIKAPEDWKRGIYEGKEDRRECHNQRWISCSA